MTSCTSRSAPKFTRSSLFTACAITSCIVFAIAAAAQTASSGASQNSAPQHVYVHVTLPASSEKPASGRLLVFIEAESDAKAETKNGEVEEVDLNPFRPASVSIAAKEVDAITPGQTIDVDADDIAYPAGFSALKVGKYYAQVVLDVNHNYNYLGRAAGDLISKVQPVDWKPGTTGGPSFVLSETVPARDPWTPRPGAPQELLTALPIAKASTEAVDFTSPLLSAFWGRPIPMKGWVLLPPGYKDGTKRYPTVYFTHGFSGNQNRNVGTLVQVSMNMQSGKMPAMIWVFLDESSATGTHEFADSVNNGPWGEALTTELIPALEAKYRMDGKVTGRFLQGHSSGGWATLWLQTRYPKVFGGTWSTSPDPSDFHDFTGIDLYAPHANAYHRADGTAIPLIRDKGEVQATWEQFAKLEPVMGPYGGQIASFEWVFSPRGKDGRPEAMFDRATGDVNPQVAEYWRDHYDIAYRLKNNWTQLKPDLDGKIHVIVGTADTFYLDGAAHKLKAVLDDLNAKAEVRFIEGRTHFDLYRVGDDRFGLMKEISWQMYAVARPGSRPPQ